MSVIFKAFYRLCKFELKYISATLFLKGVEQPFVAQG